MILTGESRSTRGRTCPIATLSTTNPREAGPLSVGFANLIQMSLVLSCLSVSRSEAVCLLTQRDA